MTQKRETWQPPRIWIPGLSLPRSFHVFSKTRVKTYQKISLHLPSFWGKNCSFQGYVSKNKSVELSTSSFKFFRTLILSSSGQRCYWDSLCCWCQMTEQPVFTGQGFSSFGPLPSPLQYNNKDPTCHVFPPSPKPLWLTHFWKKVVGKSFQTKVLTVFKQEGRNCPFSFLLIGLVLEFWTGAKIFSWLAQ